MQYVHTQRSVCTCISTTIDFDAGYREDVQDKDYNIITATPQMIFLVLVWQQSHLVAGLSVIFVIYILYLIPSLFPHFQGMVDILFTVYDLDGTVSISPSSDIVDNIFFAPQLEAVQFRNSSFTPVMTYMGNYSMLDLSFRLICGEDHYGPQCVFCVDTNNTSGHYTCDSSGKKVCLEGYQNSTANCIECVPAEDCGKC